jgi:hypothetical protein
VKMMWQRRYPRPRVRLRDYPRTGKMTKKNQLLLGQTQIRSGMKEKGHDTLLAVMKSTQDPMMMNIAAYELAGAGQELSETEAVSRKSVELSGNRVRSRADWMAQTAKWREEPISTPGDRSALIPVTIAP